MKLSFKFFCIAYITVLLSTGFGGIFLINNVTDTIWNSRVEQVNAAQNYAADSFLAFADISDGKLTESRKINILSQIKKTLDSSITYIDILDSKSVGEDYSALSDNQVLSRFVKSGGSLILESVCRLNTGTDVYFLAVYSDFTDINEQCRLFRSGYGLAVLFLSAVSGLILFTLAKKVTAPLNRLAKTADGIASGNYGETVDIKSRDYEIVNLSKSFNAMSETIAQKIKEINEEIQRRDIFVADFTHEIKTPMTAIIGYAEMLNSYELEPYEQRQAAQAVYNEGKRLEKLSLQLLDLYVYKNEKIELETVNLKEIEKQLRSTLEFSAEKYGVILSVNFDDIYVCVNGILLLSLIYNLADNAFKASKRGDEVKIYSKSGEKEIEIFVEDKGRGISNENIKLLTQPFYREDKARSRELGGAGLGLAVCREIALLHNTELNFQSEKGKGTTVSFKLKTGERKKDEQN